MNRTEDGVNRAGPGLGSRGGSEWAWPGRNVRGGWGVGARGGMLGGRCVWGA